jgi:hypothetical protein
VEAVAMPPDIVNAVAQFIAEHHVERPFVKRNRGSSDRPGGADLPGGKGQQRTAL